MCRAEASRIVARKAELDALGVTMNCVVHEDLPGKGGAYPGEVEAFAKDFWQGAVFLDKDKALYAAVGGGKATQSSLAGFLARLLNPWGQLVKNAKRGGKTPGNLTGDGFTHGGVYVMSKGAATPVFAHAEAEIGDHPPTQDLIDACKKASARN